MDSKLKNADDDNSMMEISEENESRKRKADDTFPVDSSDVCEKEEQVEMLFTQLLKYIISEHFDVENIGVTLIVLDIVE